MMLLPFVDVKAALSKGFATGIKSREKIAVIKPDPGSLERHSHVRIYILLVALALLVEGVSRYGCISTVGTRKETHIGREVCGRHRADGILLVCVGRVGAAATARHNCSQSNKGAQWHIVILKVVPVV